MPESLLYSCKLSFVWSGFRTLFYFLVSLSLTVVLLTELDDEALLELPDELLLEEPLLDELSELGLRGSISFF